MYRSLILIASLFTSGCSSTFVYSPKYVIVENSKEVELETNITGSDLTGAKANQESQGELKIPLLK